LHNEKPFLVRVVGVVRPQFVSRLQLVQAAADQLGIELTPDQGGLRSPARPLLDVIPGVRVEIEDGHVRSLVATEAATVTTGRCGPVTIDRLSPYEYRAISRRLGERLQPRGDGMRRLLAIAASGVVLVGVGATGALAGEVKGPPGTPGVAGSNAGQPTGAVTNSNSICSHSGLNDMNPAQGPIDR